VQPGPDGEVPHVKEVSKALLGGLSVLKMHFSSQEHLFKEPILVCFCFNLRLFKQQL